MSHRKAQESGAAPTRVLVDLGRMQPGPGHGGVKPLIYGFLGELAAMRTPAGPRFALTALGRPELAPELPTGVALTARPDPASYAVVYSPFGFSPLLEGGRPGVALIVDVLHRELPGALPIEEVHFRDEQFQRLARLEGVSLQCISEFTRDCVLRHFGVAGERCFVTSVPVHQRLPAGEGGLPRAAPPVFFYPANFWPHKNHEVLLVALRLHQRAVANPWRLFLTGHADERSAQVLEMAAGLGIAEHVTFAGHLDDAAFARCWSEVGALVFPSLHEGFAIPLVEAMHVGVPIIASDAAAIPETAGGAALLVDAGSPARLAEAMDRIATEPALRGELIAAGRRRVAQFSLATEAEKLADRLEAATRRGAA